MENDYGYLLPLIESTITVEKMERKTLILSSVVFQRFSASLRLESWLERGIPKQKSDGKDRLASHQALFLDTIGRIDGGSLKQELSH